MNIFRLLGDISHLLAIIVLLRKIWLSRSCAGESFDHSSFDPSTMSNRSRRSIAFCLLLMVYVCRAQILTRDPGIVHFASFQYIARALKLIIAAVKCKLSSSACILFRHQWQEPTAFRPGLHDKVPRSRHCICFPIQLGDEDSVLGCIICHHLPDVCQVQGHLRPESRYFQV